MKQLKIYKGLCAIMLSGSVLLLNGCGSAPSSYEKQPIEEETKEQSNIKEEEKEVQDSVTKDVFETNEPLENENQLVELFEKGKQKLYEIERSETTEKMKDTVYHASVKMGDFILEGGAIGGYTWDQISDSTKTKILNIANDVDNLLVEHFPEEKEWVLQKWQSLKVKTSETVKDFIGEENYEFWGNKKDECIDKASDLYESGKSKVKDKYQEWKNRHE